MKKVQIGETLKNNFGSTIILTKYENCNNIDVYFPDYNWTAFNARYKDFKKGSIRCPYEPRIYNVAYLGEGIYKAYENNKATKCYSVWKSMLERCYNSKYKENKPTYKECKVCDEWLNYQNFAKWFEGNYYTIENEKIALDKDILVKNNKIYSPDTCIFVPVRINSLFLRRQNCRGELPIGVHYVDSTKKYEVQCANNNLGAYDTSEEAFSVYKQYKENMIKQVADEYKECIPRKLYNAMYEYEVEIDD